MRGTPRTGPTQDLRERGPGASGLRRGNPAASEPWAGKAAGSYTSGMAIPDLLSKIQSLPAEDQARVEHFVDQLREGKQELAVRFAFAKLSERAFAEAWDNQDDAVYDAL